MGGARTALFNWLYARHQGGQFLLRIEDTDRERSSEEHVQVILDGLTWLGLDWDEDLVFQSAGIERHRALAERLLSADKAYEDDGAIRFRVPDAELAWEDAVLGKVSFQGTDIQDFVILRSDRSPTYNFAVVADDLEMRLTHVIRGNDHVSNTPKQIAVYRALGHEPPTFGHVPMIHGTDGKKLSKRHGATAVGDYREQGILPGALRNFLALLGWNPKDERELFFDVQELVDTFSIDDVQKKSAIFDPAKLEWMNGQYISQTPNDDLLRLIEAPLGGYDIAVTDDNRERVLRVIGVAKPRARTTLDLAHRVAIRLDQRQLGYDDKAKQQIAKDTERFVSSTKLAREFLGSLSDTDWQPEALETHLRQLASDHDLKPKDVFQPIRIAVSGSTVSEPVNELLYGVGKEESLNRLEKASHDTPELGA